jgi:hypothetical protein
MFAFGSVIFLVAPTSTGNVTFTSSVSNTAHLADPRGVTFFFTNVNPSASIVGSSISSFTAAAGGTFNATPQAVPEPSSMVIAGLCATGLIGYGLRRRKAAGE